MLMRKLKIIFVMMCLLLTTIPAVLCLEPVAPIVYVTGNNVTDDSSGNFNCDGINDEVQINQALEYVSAHPEFTTVHLKGPFTYNIRDTLYIGDNTILEGDSGAVLKLGDHVKWPVYKAMIEQKNSSGNHDITIRGFEIDGNHDGNLERARGAGYHILIFLKNSCNISVYNMYMHDSHADGLKVENGIYNSTPTNVKFYNNRACRLGHDVLYCIRATNVEAYNNEISCRTNSALRMVNSNRVKLHDNTITSEMRSGGPGIEIQKSGSVVMDDLEINSNLIYDTYGPGIWIFGYGSYPRSSAQNIYIHDNIFQNTGLNRNINWAGGIILSGFNSTLIENNVFDGCYGAAIKHSNVALARKAPGIGYTTTIRDNEIKNTRAHPRAGNGYGIYNKLTGSKFILENNSMSNNSGGNYK